MKYNGQRKDGWGARSDHQMRRIIAP